MPTPLDELIRRIEYVAGELVKLSESLYGEPKRAIPGVVHIVSDLEIKAVRLWSAIIYLRVVCGVLFVMNILTMLTILWLIVELRR